MPRKARKLSKTGIYHVLLRGINQQQIFQDDEDNLKFLEILKECSKANQFTLYGYCLMGNHVHLLIKTGTEELGHAFKRIGTRYVYWYNVKYKRVGHLFQDRFKSEPVEDENYFLTVLRYIHQNPIKAGEADTLEAYVWSSYREYVGTSELIDSSYALEIIGPDAFTAFNKADNDDTCLEDEVKQFRLNDNEAKNIIKEICNCETVEGFQNIPTIERNDYIKRLKEKGLTIRQISRLTGISRGIVERI